MKNALSMVLLSFLVLTGCRSFEKTTYQATGVAQISVDRAMISWGNYVAKFHPPATQETAVKLAYEKYQAATVAVINTAQTYATNKDTKSAFDAAIATASAALSELIGVIQAFGVNLQ